jgi:outer membrane protein assembly factor BamB
MERAARGVAVRARTRAAPGRRRTITRCVILCGAAATLIPAAAGSIVAAPSSRATAATIGSLKTVAAPTAVDDWAMFRHDSSHLGISAETHLAASNSSSLKMRWSANTGNISYSSPAIAYNASLGRSLVYVGNQSGVMTAYDSTTGAVVWSYTTPKIAGLSKEIESSPAVSNNVVYFGSGDYHEYAINATTGAFICTSVSTGGHIASSAVIANPDGLGDVVYFGDNGPSGGYPRPDGGHEWAMNAVGSPAGQCTTKWSFIDFGSPPGSQANISGVYSAQAFAHLANGTPVVVFGTTDPDDAIYAVNATTGIRLWFFQTAGGIDADVGAPPTISAPGVNGFGDGVVYETAKSAITYAVDLTTGAQIWAFDIRAGIPVSGSGNPAQSGASLVGNAIYLGDGLGLFSLNATTGALLWTSPVTSGIISSPSISGAPGDQVIFVGDLAGVVHAFSLATGAALFQYSTGALIFASAGVSAGQFFISCSNGNLYAFGTDISPAPSPPPPPLQSFHPHNVGAPQVAVTPDGSTQLVFWKDASTNQLAEAWYTGVWNGPAGFPQLGALSSTPGVAVTKDGSTQLVFWQGPSGHLMEAWYTGVWNGPLDITNTYLGGHGILGSAPSVTTTKDGTQLVFWRGNDGHLAEAWFSGTWHGPVDFTTLGSMASAPSATITADGSTQLVFFQGTNNLLTEDWFTGVWNGPMTLGSLASQPSVAVTPDGSTQLVFYKSAAGHLLESWYTGSWNGPVDFTATAFGGTGLLTSSPSATVTVDGSTQIVFWQGSGNTLWEGWYAGGAWHGPVSWSG